MSHFHGPPDNGVPGISISTGIGREQVSQVCKQEGKDEGALISG